MESDAISRSRVLEALEAEKARLMGGRGCDWPFTGEVLAKAVDTVIDFIKQVPALDVAPVVHARWNEDDGTCSACYHEACYDEWTEPKWDYDWDENLVQTGEETHIKFIFSPYCPNCGARMDGEAE